MAESSTTNVEYLPAFQTHSTVLNLTAVLSTDRAKLFIDCSWKDPGPTPPQKCKRDDIIALLTEHISAAKLELAIIDNIVKDLNEGRPVVKRRIARGIPAENGVDGRISFLVKKYQPPTENRERDGSDLRHIHSFDNVSPNTPIARIYHPTDGRDGHDVFDKPIKAIKGKKARYFLDKSVRVIPTPSGPSYDLVVSEIEGYAAEENSKIKVVNELSIDGDIDFVTGSIDFIGSLKIKGGIMKGFYAMAKGNIEIGADVEEAYVESREGSIVVAGTISGHYIPEEVALRDVERKKKRLSTSRRPNIRAPKSLTVFRVHNAVIEVGENIEVGKEIINSELRTCQALIIPRGQLLAGAFNVGAGLEARLIGTPGGSHTQIFIKSDVETSSEYAELVQAINSHRQAADIIRLQLGPYADDIQAIKRLSDHQRQKIIGFLEKLKALNENITALEQNRELLLSRMNVRKQIRINFHERLHKGTEIYAENNRLLIEHDYGGPKSIVYDSDSNSFHFCGLKPLDEEEVFETPTDTSSAETEKEKQ